MSTLPPGIVNEIVQYVHDISKDNRLGRMSLGIIFKLSYSKSKLLSFYRSSIIAHISSPLLQNCFKNTDTLAFFDVDHEFLLVPKDVLVK